MARYLPRLSTQQKNCNHIWFVSLSVGSWCVKCKLGRAQFDRFAQLAQFKELVESDEGREILLQSHEYFADFKRRTEPND